MAAKKKVAAKARKLRPDAAEIAFRVMQEATEQVPKTVPGAREKNPDAVARGRKGSERGSKKGGTARAQKLSAERRAKDATNAALARWERKP